MLHCRTGKKEHERGTTEFSALNLSNEFNGIHLDIYGSVTVCGTDMMGHLCKLCITSNYQKTGVKEREYESLNGLL